MSKTEANAFCFTFRVNGVSSAVSSLHATVRSTVPVFFAFSAVGFTESLRTLFSMPAAHQSAFDFTE